MQNSKQLLWKLKIFCRRSASKQPICGAYAMKHQEKTVLHSQPTSFWSQKGRRKTMGMKRVMDYNLLSQAVPPHSPLKPLFAFPVKGLTGNCTNPEVCRFPRALPCWLRLPTDLLPDVAHARQWRKRCKTPFWVGGLKWPDKSLFPFQIHIYFNLMTNLKQILQN